MTSDCIKPRTKVFVFGSLEEMAGGGGRESLGDEARVRTPRLDRCILSRWSLSYKTRLVARLAKFCRFYSDISPKISGKPENMQHRRPRCHSITAILLR